VRLNRTTTYVMTVCLLLSATASAADYQVIFLSPPGISSSANDADAGRVIGSMLVDGRSAAAMWTLASPGSYTILGTHPTRDVYGRGIGGSQQVGWSGNDAFRWTGSAATQVDMRPANATLAALNGTDGTFQVGVTQFGDNRNHATLWSLNPDSFVDLSPAGYTHSAAIRVANGRQTGHAWNNGSSTHAMLWSGTAAGAIDLHPAGYTDSTAYDLAGDQQVGFAFRQTPGNPNHAILWRGSAASAVDLHPNLGFAYSFATATNGDLQVGYVGTGSVYFPGNNRAVLWDDTADSALDLHAFLPPGYSSSEATGIDAGGVIYGTAVDNTGAGRVVAWVAVPEPSVALTLTTTLGLLLARRRR
jgi:hypothetical protein